MLRAVVKFVALLLLLSFQQAYAAIAISSTRVWPAQDYTRLTIESKKSIRHNLFTISNPDRLVIDLEDVELGATLNELAKKIGDNDPYIKSARVGYFKPGVVRLVLDLKSEVKPQLFVLKPVSEYGYRLVLDVYPAHPIDPLMALLEQTEAAIPEVASAPTAAGQPTPVDDKVLVSQGLDIAKSSPPVITAPSFPELRARTLIIAIDAGHGGEDPGARGRYGSLQKNNTLAIARKGKNLIDETPNMRGVLIRDGDYFKIGITHVSTP